MPESHFLPVAATLAFSNDLAGLPVAVPISPHALPDIRFAALLVGKLSLLIPGPATPLGFVCLASCPRRYIAAFIQFAPLVLRPGIAFSIGLPPAARLVGIAVLVDEFAALGA